ncbi:NADH-ubiquinone oxidoreductase 20 subunit [Wickerhamiella sorbophila]|uniref:NADH-ubiquinone oxidoreductase 20 subunit n=1 Tax=Wickerhamiella sorbophila TaxID=45607 RepID=A0A2T0FH71_9ASCO|nr:NADH-ubiquinone oxidoreductase 20 subunit [Wickerhamiella sorbophila]PRT54341.1 NADH-ubiquinone oxidoreductase 20 subunit [Wickerhamiella sorbophila]
MTSQGNVVLHNAEYEIIDQDPHFSRVVKYFRGSDYLKIAAFAASGPLFLAALSGFSSGGKKFHVSPRMFRWSTGLGLTAGFLNQYGVSSLRFQGINENAREVALDRYEIKSRLARGEAPYGESRMPEWIQNTAARNSTYSFLNISVIPWFNLVNHNHHGVSLDRYYETRPGEEKWGFDLKK